MRVRLLGPVDVVVAGVPRSVGGSRRRAVLAVLALHPGTVVGIELIVDAVWGDAAPPTAVNTVQRHVSTLRQVLGSRAAVVSRPRGYVLESATDVADAESAIGAGLRSPDAGERRNRLAEALALWRGPSLFDVKGTAWLDAQSRRLEDLRHRAGRDLVEAQLNLGEHSTLTPELESLAGRFPFDEQVHAQLMLALYRAGRQADALATFRRLEKTLSAELGIAPGQPLRDLHAAILRQDPDLAPRTEQRTEPQTATATTLKRPVPAQLPPAVPVFTGRTAELAELDAGPLTVVSGTAGVGKSALVVQWAHRAAGRFPDGQLHVDLRGFGPDGAVVPAADAIRGFLDAWGVAPDAVPRDAPAQAALYRSLLAGKRVLVVLDNARDAAQVRPLLPGAPGCAVVVTSRHRLEALAAADGARLLTLDPLAPPDARELLARRVGAERVAAEPEAVDDIVARCAGLPLALAVVAGRALARPGHRLADHAGALRAASPLESLRGGDAATDVRTVLSWSQKALTPDAALLFRCLGRHPGPTLTTAAAASLLGRPATAQLGELVDGNLLAEPAPGRFVLHDLLHAFAREQAHDGADITRRMLDHYLHTAYAAAAALGPQRDRPVPPPPVPGVVLSPVGSREAALAWFSTERLVLAAMLRQAEHVGLDVHLWQLAWVLAPVLDRHGRWADSVATQRAGLAAAGRTGDGAAQARLHRTLGRTLLRLDDPDGARRNLDRALDLTHTDPVAQGHAQLSVAEFHDWHGRPAEALDHARRALHLFRSGGDDLGATLAFNACGWFAAQTGDFDVALVYCRRALAFARRTGQRTQQAHVLDSLGRVHDGLGRRASAVRCYRQAVTLFHELGERYDEATSLIALAAVAPSPERHLTAALDILDDLAHPDAAKVRERLLSGT